MDLRSAGGEVRRFLDAPRYGVVGTSEPDGTIWQAVVWYALGDAGIVLNARHGRRWLANLRRDPRLSLAVADGEDYVILRGTADVIDDPERGLAEALALARRYGSDDTYEGQRRVGVLFHPEHVAVHGEIHLAATGPPRRLIRATPGRGARAGAPDPDPARPRRSSRRRCPPRTTRSRGPRWCCRRRS